MIIHLGGKQNDRQRSFEFVLKKKPERRMPCLQGSYLSTFQQQRPARVSRLYCNQLKYTP